MRRDRGLRNILNNNENINSILDTTTTSTLRLRKLDYSEQNSITRSKKLLKKKNVKVVQTSFREYSRSPMIETASRRLAALFPGPCPRRIVLLPENDTSNSNVHAGSEQANTKARIRNELATLRVHPVNGYGYVWTPDIAVR